MFATLLVLTIVFLLASFFLQVTSSAFRNLEHSRTKEQLKALGAFFVFRSFQRTLFPASELETLFFCISATKHIVRLLYGALGMFFIVTAWQRVGGEHWLEAHWLEIALSVLGLLLISLLIGDFIPRYWGIHSPLRALKLSAPFSSLCLLATLPLCSICLLLSGKGFPRVYLESGGEPMGKVREKILEMIQDAQARSTLDEDERRLLESVATFRDCIVREVMVPRVEMFGLPVSATIREAAREASEEGYSRIPAYRESIDSIAGVLMYKDLMDVFRECVESQDTSRLDETIEGILKTALYVPETSRVSHLLQEFRQKQTHLAIVVDEYGGTEGMITIEDCLEEIVGEIADEYDEEEEEMYASLPDGSWIVDARMTIHDIEEKFHIQIPQQGEYDTIGGHAFHVAGEIPAKGLRIHHDDFDLEILESSDRCVEKVRIRPTKKPEESSEIE